MEIYGDEKTTLALVTIAKQLGGKNPCVKLTRRCSKRIMCYDTCHADEVLVNVFKEVGNFVDKFLGDLSLTAAVERMSGKVPSTYETALSPEEESGAEERLIRYCKPVELYNILQHRAAKNPYFLQRCLKYKIEAGKQPVNRQTRLEVLISLDITASDESRIQSSLLHMYLVEVKDSVGYHCLGKFEFTNCTGHGRMNNDRATLVLPDTRKLSARVKTKRDSLFILLVNLATSLENHTNPSFPGFFLLGMIPFESLHLSFKKSMKLSTVELQLRFMEIKYVGEDKYFLLPECDTGDAAQSEPLKLQVHIEAHQNQIMEKERFPSNSFSNSGSRSTLLQRSRAGDVIFCYLEALKIEVTEKFTCPFCLTKCASFKGLRFHLCSSHDLFNFEFWATEEIHAVNVSVKCIWSSKLLGAGVDPRQQTFFWSNPCRRKRNRVSQQSNHVGTLALQPEFLEFINGLREKTDDAIQPELPGSSNGLQEKTDGAIQPELPGSSNGLQEITDGAIQPELPGSSNGLQEITDGAIQPELPGSSNGFQEKTDGAIQPELPGSSNGLQEKTDGVIQPELPGSSNGLQEKTDGTKCAQSLPRSSLQRVLAPVAETKKVSKRRAASNPRKSSVALLQNRQFFHSHGAPMDMEEVMADCDSEDEVDGDVADIEDRRMLDDFVDITEDEKEMMHLWNCFVRKQCVRADKHIPWACEAFSKFHGKNLVQNPGLSGCWKLFMVQLWNLRLLDPQTMNKCNLILENYRTKTDT